MEKQFIKNMIDKCNMKIKKNSDVGISFYAFFSNTNDNPELLMSVAHWWIMIHKLDHFEKAKKIKKLLATELRKL
jgi:hypothetical protein